MKKSVTASKKPFTSPPDSEMNSATAEKLRKAAHKDNDAVYEMVESSKDGISPEEAEKRLSTYGLNEVDYDRAPSWTVQLL